MNKTDETKRYNAVAYLRISKEDGDKEESDSISNQRDLIRDFIKNKPEITLCDEKIDDGFSGVSFTRPSFLRMLEDIQAKKINCVVVKDFSRFGRNYIEAGNYLEQVFPILGVRFISVNDNFDSNRNFGAAGAVNVAFKNLIHELYSKEISEKVTSVRRTRAEAGKFVTAFAPYGFVKSRTDKNTLVVDKECAKIVNRIFEMAVQGAAMTQIAKDLNNENIPSPIMIRRQRKDNFKHPNANQKCHWTACTIARILADRRYVGDCVYGKVKPFAVGSGKAVNVPKDEWIIARGTHEAIVSEEVFEKVNKGRKNHNYKRLPNAIPLLGKIRCGVCNRAMTRRAGGFGTNINIAYFCRTYRNTSDYDCYKKKLREAEIETVILLSLNMLAMLCGQPETSKQAGRPECKKNNAATKEISAPKRLSQQLKQSRLKNYEAYKSGKISRKMFINKQKELRKIMENNQLNINRLETELAKRATPKKRPKGLAQFEALTKDVADKFVEAVFVDGMGRISLRLTFSASSVFAYTE